MPDYSLSNTEVYFKIAAHVLRTRQNLDLLSQVFYTDHTWADFRSDGVRQLPLWVPDWSRRSSQTTFDTGDFGHSSDSEWPPIYQASQDRVLPIPADVFGGRASALCKRRLR